MADMYNKQMTPGIEDGRSFSYRKIFRGGTITEFPSGVVVDGSKCRDYGNTGDTDTLRAGNTMGKVTASGKYATSLFAVSTAAYTSGETAITISAAAAVELLRRNGASEDATLVVVGPPTAAGTVAEISTTLSAINTTTGVLTITDLAANVVAGAFVMIVDGSESPLGLIFKPAGLKVTDSDLDSIDVNDSLAIGGIIDSSQIINWPSDTSLQAWVVGKLNAAGNFVFDHPYL